MIIFSFVKIFIFSVKTKQLKERYMTIYTFELGGNIKESGGRNNKTYTWELIKAKYESEPTAIYSKKIDLKDMFPDNTGEVAITDPTETGRAPGFNWTSEATNVKNSDYEITPGALYPIIQARGNEIYDADKQSSYLDYEFYLTSYEDNS